MGRRNYLPPERIFKKNYSTTFLWNFSFFRSDRKFISLQRSLTLNRSYEIVGCSKFKLDRTKIFVELFPIISYLTTLYRFAVNNIESILLAHVNNKCIKCICARMKNQDIQFDDIFFIIYIFTDDFVEFDD